MNAQTSIRNKIYCLLCNNDKVEEEQIKELLDEDNFHFARNFAILLNSLKDKRVAYTLENDNILFDYKYFHGEVAVMLTETGKLRRIMMIPHISEHATPEVLEKMLSDLSNDYSILIDSDEGKYSVRADRKYAVSSLIKIAVASAVADRLKNGEIDEYDRTTIRENDISYLSTGLSAKDAGRRITVRELLSYMLIASDNTAMDILIRKTGEKNIDDFLSSHGSKDISIPLSKELYEKTWCSIKDEEMQRKRAMSDIEWKNGMDYFASLNDIYKISDTLRESRWLPWDELKDNEELIYKGGNAPGILSSFWTNRHKTDKNRCLAFTVNSSETIPMAAEICINECARRILSDMKLKKSN